MHGVERNKKFNMWVLKGLQLALAIPMDYLLKKIYLQAIILKNTIYLYFIG